MPTRSTNRVLLQGNRIATDENPDMRASAGAEKPGDCSKSISSSPDRSRPFLDKRTGNHSSWEEFFAFFGQPENSLRYSCLTRRLCSLDRSTFLRSLWHENSFDFQDRPQSLRIAKMVFALVDFASAEWSRFLVVPGAIPPKFCYNERTPRGYSADGGVNQILFQRLATGNKRSEQRG